MNDEHWVEITVTARDASGQTASREFEYAPKSGRTEDAPLEVFDALVKQTSNSRVHLPDPIR